MTQRRVQLAVYTNVTYRYICSEETAKEVIQDFNNDKSKVTFTAVLCDADANAIEVSFNTEKIEGIEMREIKGF